MMTDELSHKVLTDNEARLHTVKVVFLKAP